MNDPATNLDRLHGLAMPPEVPWWPLAPGWYVVIAIILIAASMLAFRAWKKWRANAYRREALGALDAASDPPAIAEILKRTALAIAPRDVIAAKSGTAWLDWLETMSPTPLSENIRTQLTTGIYQRSPGSSDIFALRIFAAAWIKFHQS